jgi:hypothetical protein
LHRREFYAGGFVCRNSLLSLPTLRLEPPQFRCGPVEGSAEAGFVVAKDRECATAIGQGAERHRTTDGLVDFRVEPFELIALAVHFYVESGGFESEDAIETPAGGDDVVNEVDLGLADGVPVLGVGLEHASELVLALI